MLINNELIDNVQEQLAEIEKSAKKFEMQINTQIRNLNEEYELTLAQIAQNTKQVDKSLKSVAKSIKKANSKRTKDPLKATLINAGASIVADYGSKAFQGISNFVAGKSHDKRLSKLEEQKEKLERALAQERNRVLESQKDEKYDLANRYLPIIKKMLKPVHENLEKLETSYLKESESSVDAFNWESSLPALEDFFESSGFYKKNFSFCLNLQYYYQLLEKWEKDDRSLSKEKPSKKYETEKVYRTLIDHNRHYPIRTLEEFSESFNYGFYYILTDKDCQKLLLKDRILCENLHKVFKQYKWQRILFFKHDVKYFRKVKKNILKETGLYKALK